MRPPISKIDIGLFLICCASIIYYIFSWSSYKACAAPIQIFLVATPITLIFMIIIYYLFRLYARVTRIRKYLDFLIIFIFTPFSLYLSVQGIIWQIIIIFKSMNRSCPTGFFQIPWVWVTLLLGVGFRYGKISYLMIKAYWGAYQMRRRIREIQQFADSGDYERFNEAVSELGGAFNDKIPLLVVDIKRLEKKYHHQGIGKGEDNEENCAICLVEFNEEEKVITLPKCGHTFHSECVTDWLKKKPLCPMCRGNVRTGMKDLESQAGENQYRPPPADVVGNIQ